MRTIRALLLFLLALGAGLPACAHPAGGAMAMPAAAQMHQTERPGRPAPQPCDHRAATCIGCATAVPQAPLPIADIRIDPLPPVTRGDPPLRGRMPAFPAPPPRLVA